jgi:hypothetical protein
VAEERAHAAYALFEIAEKEPGLLDPDELSKAFVYLQRLKDAETLDRVNKTRAKLHGVSRVKMLRYGP